jgi:Putative DNA-binding domain
VRLQIYRNHAILTLTGALKATFPVVCRLMDERFFRYAAREYIRESLPSRPSALPSMTGAFPISSRRFRPVGNSFISSMWRGSNARSILLCMPRQSMPPIGRHGARLIRW